MPKFLISDTLPCYVNFRRVIEAENGDAAHQAWMDGETGEELSPEIGDSIDELGGGETEVTPYDPDYALYVEAKREIGEEPLDIASWADLNEIGDRLEAECHGHDLDGNPVGPQYDYEGEAVDIALFISDNEIVHADDLADIRNLKVGEELRYGGGAAPITVLRRVR